MLLLMIGTTTYDSGDGLVSKVLTVFPIKI